MSTDSHSVLRQALNLPVRERAAVAAELLASLDGEADAQADQFWAEELERRAKRAIAGESRGSAWADARLRIRNRLDRA